MGLDTLISRHLNGSGTRLLHPALMVLESQAIELGLWLETKRAAAGPLRISRPAEPFVCSGQKEVRTDSGRMRRSPLVRAHCIFVALRELSAESSLTPPPARKGRR